MGDVTVATVRIKDFAEAWIDRLEEGASLSPQTIATMRSNLNAHILPAFGDQTVCELSIVSIERWASEAGLARHSAKRVLATLSALLRDCHAETGASVPQVNRARLRREQEREPVRALSMDDLAKLILSMRARHPAHPYSKPWIPLMTEIVALTGLRLGEALGLTWGDVDLRDGKLHVRRSMHKNGALAPTKSSRSREIVLLRQAETALDELEQHAIADGLGPRSCVFPVHHEVFRRRLAGAGKDACLPWVTPHTLRHTYASLLLSHGAPAVFVAEQMGHSSVNVTERVYAHWIGDSRAVIDKVNQAIEGGRA